VYQSDPNLSVPADETPLWRYLDFPRFMSLLDSATIWFARADTFTDHYELGVPAADLSAARAGAGQVLADPQLREGIMRFLADVTGLSREGLAGLPDGEVAELLLSHAGQALYISCWQEDEDESAGMWDSYAPGGSGDRDVFLGRVCYLDYQAGSWGPFHWFAPAFHKRRIFRHEQEVRAVIVWPSYRDLADGMADITPAAGIPVPVDLTRLIQHIVIAPTASSWFPGLVTSILHRYGLSAVPMSSELTRAPDW
jgi:hypothetical protein